MDVYIKRRDVLSLAKKGYLVGNGNYQSVKNYINSIPAADVRPVVLCRDCDMYECHEYDGGLKYVCRLFKRQMQETDFCSYGEKRE